MPKRRKQTWTLGDYFEVPLLDGSFAVGQIIGREPDALNSVICALFPDKHVGLARQFQSPESDPISVLFTTIDLLDAGKWRVIGHGEPLDASKYLSLDELRKHGFVGVDVVGSGNVVTFLNAYFGLYPWDGFFDPLYFDKLLLSPDRRPARPFFKGKSLPH